MLDERPQANQYDKVPYQGGSYESAHPRHLEAIATLFGMKPPPIPNSRVLELGCASGANLIPQAQELRGAHFVGIDFSQRQIDEGMEIVRTLGLKNIDLRCTNILDVDDGWGQFDYILCHGIFSWVPPRVQEKILQICKRNLAGDGVAGVSYNTFPGWHIAGAVADMMRYHTGRFEDPAKKIEEAKAILKSMAESSDDNTAIGKAFRQEFKLLERADNDSYVFHDHLEAHNEAFYLSRFVRRASDQGLQYLADASLSSMLIMNYPQPVQEALRSLSLVEQEQYLDFLFGRRFRTSLLCHQEVQLQRRLTSESITPLQLTLAHHPDKLETHVQDEQITVFRAAGDQLTVANPAIIAAMLHLKDIYPEYISYPQLRAAAMERAGTESPHDVLAAAETLGDGLLAGLCVGLIDVCVHPPACISKASARPLASPLARLQAGRGISLTTQRHEMRSLDDLGRYVIRRLDGTHDRQALIGSMKQAVDAGKLVIRKNDQVMEDVDERTLSPCIDATLTRLCQAGLVVS